MRLPENKKDRLQVLVLIAIGAIAVVFLAVQHGIKPLLGAQTEAVVDLESLNSKLQKAKLELNGVSGVQTDYDAVVAEVGRICSNYVVHPILGSYLLGVNETVDNTARSVGMKVDSVQEIGMQEIPGKRSDNSVRDFKGYSVRVTGQGSYEQICMFFRQIEQQNPFLSATEVRIVTQPDSPERHRVEFHLEWPVAVNPEALQGSAAPAETVQPTPPNREAP